MSDAAEVQLDDPSGRRFAEQSALWMTFDFVAVNGG
jgi:hypothetical protein